MKPDKQSRAKVIILIVILVAVWAVIGIRYLALSRYWKAKAEAAQQHVHLAGDEGHAVPSSASSPASSPASSTASSTASSGQLAKATPSLRVAALVAPVPPPKSDPFQPAISPRTTRRPTSRSAAAQPEAPSLVPLPPPPSPSSSTDRNRLRVSGIIIGNPSTAVLRVGDEHYVVREGYRLDNNIVVQAIDQSSVTLRDSHGTYRLRLGQ
jgi:hypothetical protein